MGLIDNVRMRIGERVAGGALEKRVERRVRRDASLIMQREVTEAIQQTLGGSQDKLKVDLEQLRLHGAPRQVRESALLALQTEMFELYHLCPAVTNAVNMLTAIVAGNGIHVDVEGDEGQDIWDEFDEKVDYTSVRAMKSIQDRFLFGEVLHWFIRANKRSGKGPIVDMRVLDPIAPGGLQDIVVDENDVERVYYFQRRGMFGTKGKIKPQDATHWKLASPGTARHGRPILESAYDDISQLRQTNLEMFVFRLVRLRNSVWVFSLEDLEDDTEETPEITIPIPEPAQAMVLPPGVKAERPSMREMMVASAKFEDGPIMAAYLGMSQAISMPVHLLMMKFDETTFASSLAAEAPTMKASQRHARAIEALVRNDVIMVLESHGINTKGIVKVRVEPAVFRDMDKERQSISLLVDNKIIDRRTARETLGHDPDEVEKRIEKEMEDSIALEMAANPNGGDFVPIDPEPVAPDEEIR